MTSFGREGREKRIEGGRIPDTFGHGKQTWVGGEEGNHRRTHRSRSQKIHLDSTVMESGADERVSDQTQERGRDGPGKGRRRHVPRYAHSTLRDSITLSGNHRGTYPETLRRETKGGDRARHRPTSTYGKYRIRVVPHTTCVWTFRPLTGDRDSGPRHRSDERPFPKHRTLGQTLRGPSFRR